MADYADRVQETTTTAGVGAVSMGGAVAGYQTWAAAFPNGSGTKKTYCLVDGAAWEVGIGTLTSGTPWTLSRDTILASSTGAVLVLSGGSTSVFCDLAAQQVDWPTVNTIIDSTNNVNVQLGHQLLVASNFNILGNLNAIGDLAIL